MQTTEFNKLINGEPEPKWIEMPQAALPTLPNTTEPVEVKPTKGMLSAEKVKEKVVPIHIAKAVSDFVELQRRRRIPERVIRRAVMRKWNIKMLK